MKIERHFTAEHQDPYHNIRWESRVSELKDVSGKVLFHQDDVIVPETWSQVATDILAQKYFRKAGLPTAVSPEGRENDARQVFHRLAHTWMEWGRRSGYFDGEADASAFYDETVYMLARQMAAPNSPQWFNTGLYEVYGITGPPQGHFYYDPEAGRIQRSKSAYERPQPHACFILDVEDDLVNENGIMDLVSREARLFKYGSGTGTNFSKLRGSGESLSGGGVSSGLLSFLKIADRSAAAIKSGGTTRRAAKMVTLDADHPDIERFINWKVGEEHKVASMVAGSRVIARATKRIMEAVRSFPDQGPEAADPFRNNALAEALEDAVSEEVPTPYLYQIVRMAGEGVTDLDQQVFSTDWDDEAYVTVAGQSANNSVRLDNRFLEALLEDADWDLVARTSGEVVRTVPARDIWNMIAEAAWQCADPGLQFHTTVNEWHTCPEDGEIRASNPCSEYMFLDDTACNLASLNLLKFYDTETGEFLIQDLQHAVKIWTTILEISIVMAQFPSKEIARKSYLYRTLGLGFANLGSTLMVMGLPYDSREGRAVAAALASVLTGEGYAASAEIAGDIGPFDRYENNKEHMLRVIRNHRRAAWDASPEEYEKLSITPQPIESEVCPPSLLDAARLTWDRALRLGEQNGYRNAQISAIAPTGTIGLVMDCDTTGIEPDFALVKYKKLAGGGFFKIINQSIPPALELLGYSKEEIDSIVSFCVGHGSLQGAPEINEEVLRARGFGDEELEILEEALHNAYSFDTALGPWLFNREFLVEKLGLSEEVVDDPGFSLFRALGFSEEQIEEAETYACGTMGVKGAPYLKEEHLPVFDTASPSGKRSNRSIPWQAHIDMMAAVQPFVSGAISKTINMPSEATIDDVKGAYMRSWKAMLKSVALYRDGSKLSQPLSTSRAEDDDAVGFLLEQEREHRTGGGRNRTVERGTEQASSGSAESRSETDREDCPQRRNRLPLPTRRLGYTQKAKIGGHSLFLRTGEYEDGSLGEIFLDMHKEGAAFRSLLNSFAIAVSLGLQYGVPLEEYVDAFTFTRFEPNGVVQGHSNVKMATSVLDYIFRDLALTYLNRTDLVQVKPDDLRSTATDEKSHTPVSEKVKSRGPRKAPEESRDEAVLARKKGYEGDPCPTCGHFTMVRNGTCLKCLTCGSTTGCS
ncbi:MAG: adenosylcobalamin-dependent ribonucleoside-diphosphate reductase [Spirochaetales bacterium]|nr:adenosylcobalamin-dependent ribonucleoside-diphosphate reductase [Spirochaetales bacterium]MCF7938400.1 adenosylcobalamin-dependent ribonucleoside-diphosphate reductase [Spirochaetales bacterium]